MDYHKFPSQQPTRKAWQGMMNRCYTTTNKDYPGLGGRGIKVCDRWHKYDNFLADMGEKPANALLSRYRPDGDFDPDNCYWQPKFNTRTNRLYGIWKGMKRRCGVIGKKPMYANRAQTYKLRGVDICPDWAESFVAFAADVGEPPTGAHTLDRIDNAKGYWPDNVRWALPKAQANNRSDNVWIEMDGQRMTFTQWCEYYGVPRAVVTARWRVLFNPAHTKNRPCQQLSPSGEVLAEHASAKAAAEATGLTYAAINKCLSGGNQSCGGFLWRYTS